MRPHSLEPLEPRIAPATITITHTDHDGGTKLTLTADSDTPIPLAPLTGGVFLREV